MATAATRGLRRDLGIAYAIALAGAAALPIFLPFNWIGDFFWLTAPKPFLLTGIIAPLIWLLFLGWMFTRHGGGMLWALPGAPVAFSSIALIVFLLLGYVCSGPAC